MKRLAVLAMFAGMLASPAFASDELKITEIIEAQYVGCDEATAAFKKTTFRNIAKNCNGRDRCRFVSRQEADDLNCKKLVVRYECSDGSEREIVHKVNGNVMAFQCE
jgi:hypothetical protein